MSKYKLVNLISNEIARLNEEIDLRIIKGLPYEHLARRHRALLSQLRRENKRRWFAKSFSFLSFF